MTVGRDVLGNESAIVSDGVDRTAERVPAWCPVCDLVMKGLGSTKAYFDWGCCQLCYIQFVEDRELRWVRGWRPSEEEVEALRRTHRPT